MKKHIFLGIIISICSVNLSRSQSNQYPTKGDVTIRNYSPLLVLQRDTDDGGFVAGIQTKMFNGTNSWYFGNLQNDSWIVSRGNFENPLLTVVSTGNVGVGTSNPLFKLDVKGVFNVSSDVDKGGVRFNSASNSQVDSRNWLIASDGYSYGDLVFKSSSTFSGVPSDVKMTIKSNGNIGIGVINPANKLDVNGTIHSKEIKVDMNGWSDFVFKKEYGLSTLEEVEKHITEKGHLKDIPSEEEVLKDGINLGEMNSKLLQKIEELTLYMIEMKKENDAMKKDILMLKQNK